MHPLRIQFAAVDAPETKLDRAIEWLLFASLAFCPFAFGAVEAWSEAAFGLLGSAIVICFSIKLILRPDARFVWSWTYLPIAMFLVLVALQLIPLPIGVVRAISPNTVALKARLLAGLPGSDDATRWIALTFYRETTIRQLRLVAALAAIFVVVVNVFQTVESIRRLLIAITLIGLGEAILALAQDMTRSSAIYWTIAVYQGRATSGSFVNHSHFGQFMNLSIGGAIALMLLEWRSRTKDDGRHGVAHMPAEAGTPGWVGERAFLYLGTFAIFSCSIALLLSLTRGGVVSMVVAGVMTMLILRIKSSSSRKILAGVSLVAAVIVLAVAWIGFDEVFHRFASTTEANAANLRGQMLRDLREAWKQFPVFGTGLGTHPVIFPMFDHSQTAAVATHAENEYAQTMTETGAIGLGLAITFAAMIWINFAGAIRGRFSSISAIAIGLGYGFAAILIHSITDFGQHIPADALLTAITYGLLVSLARQRRQRNQNIRAPEAFRGSVPTRIGAAAIVLTACAIATYQAQRAWAADREFKIARRVEDHLQKLGWSGSDDDYAELIIHAQNAADIRPGNVEYAYWLAVYRWKWVSIQPDVATSDRNLDFARRIAAELNRARLICPTFGLPASLAGQIELFVLHDAGGAHDIRLGSDLNRNDPMACFADGELAASEGKWDLSVSRLKHYADIADGGIEVADLYVNQFKRPDLALQAVHGDLPGLERLAELLTKASGDPQILASAKQQAGDLRLRAADRAGAGAGDVIMAAQVAVDRADHDAAVVYLRRALAMEPARWDLRLELARQLAASGKTAEAMSEVQFVLRHDPDSVGARALATKLQESAPNH